MASLHVHSNDYNFTALYKRVEDLQKDNSDLRIYNRELVTIAEKAVKELHEIRSRNEE